MERRWLTRLTLTTLMMFIPIVGIACDPGEVVHIENRTAQTLIVFSNGVGFHELAPGDSASFGILEFEGVKTYEVRTLDGIVLASRTFTWCEIDTENGISIIVQNEQPTQPSATHTTPTATPEASPVAQ